MLEVKNLNKKFNDQKVLDNVSFKVNQSEIALLIGPSGVGKSTILRILNNLETADSGDILLNNQKINNHKIGMVFQNFNLFENMTVQENITFPLIKASKLPKNQADNIAKKLLKQYGLLEYSQKYVNKLSGGQKQRLAIARTLSMEPQIICLDEPTSALDPVLTSDITNIINNLKQSGHIILVSSHDIQLIEKLDATIYLMKSGKIIESAPSYNASQNQNIKNFITGEK